MSVLLDPVSLTAISFFIIIHKCALSGRLLYIIYLIGHIFLIIFF